MKDESKTNRAIISTIINVLIFYLINSCAMLRAVVKNILNVKKEFLSCKEYFDIIIKIGPKSQI